MRDIIEDLLDRWNAGRPSALASVVQTFRSAPRPPGTSLMVGPDDDVIGSVSGGCVEGAVYDLGTAVRDGAPPVLERYGVSDDDAFAVGLTCGGIIDIFVQQVDPATWPDLPEIAADVAAGRPVVVAQVVEHPDADMVGTRVVVRPGDDVPPSPGPVAGAEDGAEDRDPTHVTALERERLLAHVTADAHGLLETGGDQVLTYGPDGERADAGVRVFCWALTPKPHMVVFGAIDFAGAVAEIGAFLGYDVTVCDARRVFATPARFPAADRVVVEWPHRYLAAELAAGRTDARTVLVVLTHDPKFDVPVLDLALCRDDFAYVGAMGSRRTHADRRERLVEAGLGEAELARLASPIGLDIGASTPQEVAVSIAAEIVATRHGKLGEPLTRTSGPIHA